MNTLSLSCIDTKYYQKSNHAIDTSLRTLENCFPASKVYWFSDRPYPYACSVPVQWIPILPINNEFRETSFPLYYNYITMLLMPKHIEEDYNLLVQHDGYAVNSQAWTNDFLKFDYIGACWGEVVGNGGFSLRSKRLYTALNLLNASYDSKKYPNYLFEPHLEGHVWLKYPGSDEKIIPEDNLICRVLRPKLEKTFNITFASVQLADRFSIENKLHSPWIGKSFGFHGKQAEKYYT